MNVDRMFRGSGRRAYRSVASAFAGGVADNLQGEPGTEKNSLLRGHKRNSDLRV